MLNGLNISGNAWVQARAGNITQTQAVTAAGLAAKASGGITLDLGAPTGQNQIGVFAGAAGTGTVNLLTQTSVEVGSVGTAAANARLGGPLLGVQTQNQSATIRSDVGSITLSQNVSVGTGTLSL